jgi:hypothetical protein
MRRSVADEPREWFALPGGGSACIGPTLYAVSTPKGRFFGHICVNPQECDEDTARLLVHLLEKIDG